MKWIEDNLSLPRRVFYQEVAGKANPMERHPETPSHLQVDRRDGDGDPGPPVKDLIQKAVPRVVVLFGIPSELEISKETTVQRLNAPQGVFITLMPKSFLNLMGHSIQTVQVGFDVQAWILLLGNQERRLGKVNRPLVFGQHHCKALSRQHIPIH